MMQSATGVAESSRRAPDMAVPPLGARSPLGSHLAGGPPACQLVPPFYWLAGQEVTDGAGATGEVAPARSAGRRMVGHAAVGVRAGSSATASTSSTDIAKWNVIC